MFFFIFFFIQNSNNFRNYPFPFPSNINFSILPQKSELACLLKFQLSYIIVGPAVFHRLICGMMLISRYCSRGIFGGCQALGLFYFMQSSSTLYTREFQSAWEQKHFKLHKISCNPISSHIIPHKRE